MTAVGHHTGSQYWHTGKTSGYQMADDIFFVHFLNENYDIMINISLKFVEMFSCNQPDNMNLFMIAWMIESDYINYPWAQHINTSTTWLK